MLRGTIAFAAPLLVCLLATSLAFADGEPTIIAEDTGLIIEGNRLVYPQITENTQTGTVTLSWSDGSGYQEIIENARPEDVKPKWINVKTHRPNDNYSFRSNEYTEQLISWWSKGGRGKYTVSDNHTLVPINSSPKDPGNDDDKSNSKKGEGPSPFNEDSMIKAPRVP